MRLLAAALVALALPTAAQAGFAPGGYVRNSSVPGISVDHPANTPFTREKPRESRAHRGAVTYSRVDRAVSRELEEIYDSIDRRRKNGEITKQEARALRREAARLSYREERFASDGLSDVERRELQLSAQTLRYRVQTRAQAAH